MREITIFFRNNDRTGMSTPNILTISDHIEKLMCNITKFDLNNYQYHVYDFIKALNKM